MELLGVGPVELLIIIILGLIVVGPERLPEMARTAGRLVARLLSWLQQSPEFQTIQQVRQEFQQEITGLKNELNRTKQQITTSTQLFVGQVPSLKEELSAAVAQVQEVGKKPDDKPTTLPPPPESPSRPPTHSHP